MRRMIRTKKILLTLIVCGVPVLVVMWLWSSERQQMKALDARTRDNAWKDFEQELGQVHLGKRTSISLYLQHGSDAKVERLGRTAIFVRYISRVVSSLILGCNTWRIFRD